MPALNRWTGRFLLSAFVFHLLSVSAAQAQEDVARGPSSEEQAGPKTLLELMPAGGPTNIAFIVVLGLCSLLAVAVTLERLVDLTAHKLLPPDFLRGLQELTQRQVDNPKPFRELCERHPSTIANILKA